MTRRTPTEFTVDELGFIQTAEAKILVAVATGGLDLNDLARRELAARGLDDTGKWVGFPKARAIYERTRNVPPHSQADAEPLMKRIETTITATMLVHDERPAMDEVERLHAEHALMETVRTTLFTAFLQHEPQGSHAKVQNVTVTFSGHVLP